MLAESRMATPKIWNYPEMISERGLRLYLLSIKYSPRASMCINTYSCKGAKPNLASVIFNAPT
jgi:hypothetical protein